jgi:poly(3-hydroxybutyrate) depolymerase
MGQRQWALVATASLLMMAAGCGGGAHTQTQIAPDPWIRVGDGGADVHVPAHHDRVGVVVLPGLAEGDGFLIRQGWSELADREHFVAIYPIRGGSWNAGLCCATAAAEKRDDVGWLAAVISDARRQYGLTTILLSGNSNGAMMAERLVAERPDISRRIVIWAGSPEMPKPGRWTGSITIYDGFTDRTTPHTGGISRIGGKSVEIRPFSETSRWLVGATVRTVIVQGAGHLPEVNWPEVAWRELNSSPAVADGGQ